MYAPNNRALKYMRQKSVDYLKGEIGKPTILGGDVNSPLSETVRTNRQKVRDDIDDLNNVINQLVPFAIYRALNLMPSSQVHREYSQPYPFNTLKD